MTQYTYKQAIADPGVISTFDPTTDVLVFTTVNAGAVSVYDDGASVMFVSAIGAVTLPVRWGQLVDGVNIRFSDGSSLSQVVMLNAILGGSGADTLTTGGGDDVVATASGNDTIDGGGGADTILAGGGDDVVLESAGNDLVSGGNGNDRMSGGTGNDSLNGDSGADTLSGGNDQDVLAGNLGDDQLFGDAGDDIVYGNKGNDFIDGGSGGDTLYGGQADDIINDAAGDNLIYGNLGNDPVSGGSGADTIYGGQGDDQVTGNSGNDLIDGNRGNDIIFGGGGADVFVLTPGNGTDLDVIMDLNAEDSLDVRRTDIYSNSLVQLGTDVRVTLTSGDMVLFKDQTVAGMEPVLAPHYASVNKSGDVLPIGQNLAVRAAPSEVFALSNGNFVILGVNQDSNVFTQILDTSGKAVGETFTGYSTQGVSLYNADGAGLANGNFVVSWTTYDLDGSVASLQVFDNEGNQLGEISTIYEGPPRISGVYAGVWNLSDGGFIATWQAMGVSGDQIESKPWGQLFDSTGAMVSEAFRIGDIAEQFQQVADVCSLSGGGFVATLYSRHSALLGDGSTSLSSEFTWQAFDSDGSPSSTQFQLPGQSRIEQLGSGELVAITRRSNGEIEDIIGQRYLINGEPVGNPFFVVPTQEYRGMELRDVVATKDGGFIATWIDREMIVPGDFHNFELDYMGRRFDSDGNPLGEYFLINDSEPGYQYHGHADILEDGRFIGVWHHRELEQIGGQFFEMYDGVI